VTTVLAFLFVLGVLVFVHELGHFLAARRVGIRVLVFSLGFGPKLLKTKRGDTEYCISLIPLGGYVKMAGESAEESKTGAPDEFMSKTKWERFQVLIMGPVMNLVTAVVVLAFVLGQGAQIPAFLDEPPVVGGVVPNGPADRSGIRAGDRILTVGGRSVDTWESLTTEIAIRPDRDVPITLVRDGTTVTVNMRPDTEERFQSGVSGLIPRSTPLIQSVVPNDPADKAGVKAGDIVLAVNGERVANRDQLVEVISANPDKATEILVDRGGQEVSLSVIPELRGNRGMIGVTITEPTKTFTPGPWEAVKLSVERNIEGSTLIFRTLGGLFVGETSLKQLQGPVAIAQLSGESAQLGWAALFTLMATLSLNLGLLNLFPIPMLDGGHILIMALEGIARRDFSMQVKEKMLLAGFVVILMLMVTVIYNDLTRISWLERLMPWRN
jgi:regulator of sigma E protease